MFDSSDVDDICNKFTSLFLGFCKCCIPCKQILIRENDKPWFNSEIRYNIRLRDKLRKKSCKTKSTQDLLLYKRQRNKVNNMKKYAKENYINNISETISNYENEILIKLFGKLWVDLWAKVAVLLKSHRYVLIITNMLILMRKNLRF